MANKNYVDNKVFYDEMVKMKEDFQSSGEYEISDFVGKCFMDIASGLSNRPNFINYTFKDDMIFDGVENCVRYCHNFNPDKSKNPFSYFTQIIYYAFVRRIEKEKKHNYIKHKMTANLLEKMSLDDVDNHEYIMNVSEFMKENSVIDVFEERMKSSKSSNSRVANLEKFME